MVWGLLILVCVFIGLYIKEDGFRKGVKSIINYLRRGVKALLNRLINIMAHRVDEQNKQLIETLKSDKAKMQKAIDALQQQLAEKTNEADKLNNIICQLENENQRLAKENVQLKDIQKHIYPVSDFVASEFRNQFSAVISLLNGGEEIIKNYYEKAVLHRDNELVQKISTIYLEFILEKPADELQKWQSMVGYLRYSGIIIDDIKNTLRNETGEEQQLFILKKVVFQSLYRKYIGELLMMMETARGINTNASEAKKIEQYISNFLGEINHYGITVAYYPLFEKIIDFSRVEITQSVDLPDSLIPSDSVVRIRKYAVNSSKLGVVEEKSIVEIKN